MSLSLQQLASQLGLEFRGEATLEIHGVASAGSAGPGDLCFLLGAKYLDAINASQCSAVLVTEALADQVEGKALIFADNPQYRFAQAIHALDADPGVQAAEIHSSAQIAPSARLQEGVRVGANAVIGENASIGAGCIIGAGCVIEHSVQLGAASRLHSNVTLCHSVRIGERCILHPGVVIGGDGFGLAMHEDRWHKIPQIGSVVIGDDVEIGSNTTVDRGALDDTVIEEGCKLDNQIMIAHNVRIGAHTAMAGFSGVAGSTTVGRYCKISGASRINGHISIADHVTITATGLVLKDIREPGVYSSGTPLMENSLWHRACARFKSLDKLAQRVAKLEKSSKE